MTEDTKETVTINGGKYILEDMSAEQQYMVKQMKDLNNKTSQTQMVLDQCQVAARGFTGALIASLKPAEETPIETPTETPTEALESIEAPLTGAAASAAFDDAKVN